MRPPLELRPSENVASTDGRFLALSDEPWLTIESSVLKACVGRFVEITYRASHWDEPVRPVFRFDIADGRKIYRIGAGPVAGAGQWIGRIPAGTIQVSVSPTSRPGRFGFAIEEVRSRSWLGLLVTGLRSNPRSTRSAILTRLIGWTAESDNNLAWAVGSVRLSAYRRWRGQRRRCIDLAGLDAPRCDWTKASLVHVYLDARNGTTGLPATLATLQAQLFSRWTALVICDEPCLIPDDPRISRASTFMPPPDRNGWIMSLRPGDRLRAQALACVTEASDRYPQACLFYADEDDGAPIFKPGWSPLLQQQNQFLGRCVFLRGSLLTQGDFEDFVRETKIPQQKLDGLAAGRIHALRRILLYAAERPITSPGTLPGRAEVKVAVIIPTRDQAARLRRVVASIRRCSATQPTLVVVDNGSVRPEAKSFLDDLRHGNMALVLDRPGPFNFSAMCNDGAAAAGSVDMLVFLNDDTEILSSDWLGRLAYWTQQPTVGAVGVKLTYPDGRLQHVGVTLGLGESAGHFGAFAGPDEAGWLGRHQAVHEVSAVTGACLAVSRDKFVRVGGFDAVHLPVELSDIDLCLRLADHGWTTMVDPAIHLYHEESASRGRATFRRLNVYEEQRAYFLRRWSRVIRDDPYFHPGLSLFGWQAALA